MLLPQWSYPAGPESLFKAGHVLSDCSISGTSFSCLSQGLEMQKKPWSGISDLPCNSALRPLHLSAPQFPPLRTEDLTSQTSSAAPRRQCGPTGVTTHTLPVPAAVMAAHWLRCWGRVCGVGFVEKKREKKQQPGNGSVELYAVHACDPTLGRLRLEHCRETGLGYVVPGQPGL